MMLYKSTCHWCLPLRATKSYIDQKFGSICRTPTGAKGVKDGETSEDRVENLLSLTQIILRISDIGKKLTTYEIVDRVRIAG